MMSSEGGNIQKYIRNARVEVQSQGIKYFLTFIKRYFLHGCLHDREFIRIPMTPILFYHKPSTNDTSPPERIISPAVPKTYFFWGSFLSKYAANHSTGLAGRSLTNSLIPSSRMGTTV